MPRQKNAERPVGPGLAGWILRGAEPVALVVAWSIVTSDDPMAPPRTLKGNLTVRRLARFGAGPLTLALVDATASTVWLGPVWLDVDAATGAGIFAAAGPGRRLELDRSIDRKNLRARSRDRSSRSSRSARARAGGGGSRPKRR